MARAKASKVTTVLAMLEPGRDSAFSVACGLYWHCADYHEGQGSARYRILSTLDYHPGACERGPEPESTDAMVYDALADGSLEPETALAFIEANWRSDG